MATDQTPCPGFAPDFRVGDWLVEPSLDRLSRNGTTLRLRPQLTDLLVLLARNAGRTVSKDEILARVWEGQHVAESGMTRCIAEIRQALEDDAHQPTVVQTIPKRGYRLVAPVVFLERNSGDCTIGVEPAPPAGSGPGAASRGEDPPPAAPQPPPRQGRSVMRPAAGLAVFLGLAWGTVAWRPAPVLRDRDTVLLADVSNTTGDSAFDLTLRLALAIQLEQAPFLRVLSDDQVRNGLTLMGRHHNEAVAGPVALDLCKREGAAVLLAGSIARLGSRFAVGIEAIACETGDSINRQLVEVERKEEVLTALGTAAAGLRRALGESRDSLRQHQVPIVEATTPSLEALEALSLGDFNRDHARLDDALACYRRATELDPQFALAWARRGAAARNVGRSAAEERFGAADESTFAFQTAYDLRHRVSEPERFYILGHYYHFVAGDLNKTLETYRMWRRTYPGSIVPPTNLASITVSVLGHYEEAVPDAQEAVRMAPYSSIAMSTLVTALLGANRVPEARRALREAGQRGSTDLLWRDLAFQLAFADDDAAAMAKYARQKEDAPRTRTVMTSNLALAAASGGRLREARRLWSEAAETAMEAEAAQDLALVRLTQAETEALLGDAHAARVAVEAALAVGREPGTLLPAAVALALSGDSAHAGRLIDEAALSSEPGIAGELVWRPLARALVEAGAGRPDRALEILRPVAPYERGRNHGLAPLGVRASIELAAGRPTEAAATFRDLLSLRAVLPTSPWVPFARLGLARSLRDAGDRSASRTAYDAVVEAMKTADPDSPLLTTARRERAALGNR